MKYFVFLYSEFRGEKMSIEQEALTLIFLAFFLIFFQRPVYSFDPYTVCYLFFSFPEENENIEGLTRGCFDASFEKNRQCEVFTTEFKLPIQ